jgi:hypothetical protein
VVLTFPLVAPSKRWVAAISRGHERHLEVSCVDSRG